MVTMIYVKVPIGKAPHGTGLTALVVLEFQRKLQKNIIAIHMHLVGLMEPILQFQRKLLKEECALTLMVIFAKSKQISKSKTVDLTFSTI